MGVHDGSGVDVGVHSGLGVDVGEGVTVGISVASTTVFHKGMVPAFEVPSVDLTFSEVQAITIDSDNEKAMTPLVALRNRSRLTIF